MEDQQLLARIQRGDEAAFETLFRRYYAALVGFTGTLLPGRELAEDVVQDVLLELWRRRDTLDIGESCRAYLFRSVRNRALNELRHEGTVARSEPAVRESLQSTDAPAADAGAVEKELRGAIDRAVAALPEPARTCLTLSRRDGLTYGEIAGVLGVSVKTVEARMGRALRELRSSLAEWLPARD